MKEMYLQVSVGKSKYFGILYICNDQLTLKRL